MLIESSPTSLDPRIGTDAQSEHIDSLIFDALVRRDEHFNVQPFLAQSWETPDPLTYVFHLHDGVRFHDGRPLTSKDVQWTIQSILNGDVATVKSQAYRNVDHIDAPDPLTVVFHLRKPDPGRNRDRPGRQRARLRQTSHRERAVPLRLSGAGQGGGHRAQSELLGIAARD